MGELSFESLSSFLVYFTFKAFKSGFLTGGPSWSLILLFLGLLSLESSLLT